MATRPLMTIHHPVGRLLSGPLLGLLDGVLKENEIDTWWISPEKLPDLTVMVDVPDQLSRRRDD